MVWGYHGYLWPMGLWQTDASNKTEEAWAVGLGGFGTRSRPTDQTTMPKHAKTKPNIRTCKVRLSYTKWAILRVALGGMANPSNNHEFLSSGTYTQILDRSYSTLT
jgi:hypothetical protein